MGRGEGSGVKGVSTDPATLFDLFDRVALVTCHDTTGWMPSLQ